MTTNRMHEDDVGERPPYLDELDPPVSDEPEPITPADVAHTVERLEAGRESGNYTDLRESDLWVLWYVGRQGKKRLDAVFATPSLLPQLVTPAADA